MLRVVGDVDVLGLAALAFAFVAIFLWSAAKSAAGCAGKGVKAVAVQAGHEWDGFVAAVGPPCPVGAQSRRAGPDGLRSGAVSRVVVLGANGRTGRSVVEEARRGGHNVTAAVRSPENVDPATDPRPGTLTVVRADVRDPDDVRAAVAGHDVVVSTVGPPGVRSSRLYSDTAQALVSAMAVTGVRRLIAMSSAGVRHDDPDFALWYPRRRGHVVAGGKHSRGGSGDRLATP